MLRKSDKAELSEFKKHGFKYGTREKYEYETIGDDITNEYIWNIQ